MSQAQAQKFVQIMAADIRRLSDILSNKGLINNLTPLSTAAAQASRTYKPRGAADYHWSYDITGLDFIHVSKECLKNCIPDSANEVFLQLSVSARGICLPDASTDDPLTSLAVNVIVFGKDDGGTDLKGSWHLDRDLKKKEGKESQYLHPLYHFQYGGQEIYDFNNSGVHILLDSPRLPHFPLDGILAIDFVLSNYYGEFWSELRQEAEYKKLIESAQKRFWRPYSLSIASRWIRQNPGISEWDYKDLLPQLCEPIDI
jgi:hypothetical protein